MRLDDTERVAREFACEEGLLGAVFDGVGRRDADATVVFPHRDALEAYLRSLIRGAHPADRPPVFDGPFHPRSSQTVFVAEKAA